MHHTPTIIPCIFSLLLRMNAPIAYNIEHNQLTQKKCAISNSLPNDIMRKIFACADLPTKTILRLTCSTLYILDIKDILSHSPLIISRKDHLKYMVYTAKNNDSATFMNLLYNAHNCDHTDIFSTISCCLPQDAEELKFLDMDWYEGPYDFAIVQPLLPCIIAIYRGEKEYIKQYLIKNMLFSQVNPLHVAVSNGQLGVIEILLAHSTNINAQNSRGSTALYIAVCCDSLRIAQLLLENGADVNIANNRNGTPLLVASYDGFTEMVALLLAHKANTCIGGKLNMPLHGAIINSHTPIVRLLIEYGVDTNEMYNDRTPLMRAAERNNYEACELLLKNGAKIDATESHGYAALQIAVDSGHLKIVQLLIAYGANINHQTKYHETALSLALKYEYANIVTFLLEQPNIKINKKRTKTSWLLNEQKKNS